ncbi:DUF1858 domain-containing protein [[Clostridium] colinum]|uniref:DUF1858 domain-containing protein n=1 Tax=[Clostridium] colinum TaxID=36835 RepID=UPI002023FEFB|nr:DUF1858 domain-containing protein [[Clostridium] colinum]
MKQVTKDMKVIDVLNLDKGVFPIMMNAGMHCLGCPSSQLETLEEACEVHYLNCDELVNSINEYLKTVQ